MRANGSFNQLVGVFFLFITCAQVYGEQTVISYENNLTAASAHGSGLQVVVKPLDTKSVDSGVSEETIRTKVELLLRSHGVLVMDNSNTKFEIMAHAVKVGGGEDYAGYIRAEYKEKTANKYTITLWFKEILLAYKTTDEVYKGMAEITETFLNDLLKTKPAAEAVKARLRAKYGYEKAE